MISYLFFYACLKLCGAQFANPPSKQGFGLHFADAKKKMHSTEFFFRIPGCLNFSGWHTNMEEARQIAQKEHRHILLNFSGSDWCGPCIRLRKEIFDNADFSKMADSDLVLSMQIFPG